MNNNLSEIDIAKIINNAGGKLYLVGGAVRDMILKRESNDKDYCIVGLDVDDVLKLFPNASIRGKSFPVFDIFGSEFALARKEKKIFNGHKGFEMVTGKNITIEEDLIRRDITANSIAFNVLSQEFIDPFGGRKDIENKIIRATSKAFLEDPLRTYRVARFASELNFDVTSNTIELMKKTKLELENLSVERVWTESLKALQSPKPSLFFRVLKDAECLEVHFREIYDLIDKIQPEKYHPEGDAFEHTMCVVDDVRKMTDAGNVVYAGLVHDLGKGTTPNEMLPRHIGHEERGVELVKKLSKRLRVPNAYLKSGMTAALEHMKAGIFDNMRISTKVDFLTRIDKTVLGLEGLEIVAIADNTKKDKKINFAKIGKNMINSVNAKAYPKDIMYKEIIDRLRKERIEWLKNNLNSN